MDHGHFPAWVHLLSLGSLVAGLLCAIVIVVDEIRHPQSMWIMNLVWPLTALFGSLLWLTAYFALGRGSSRERHAGELPVAAMVFKGASHCGAGCTLGDILVEWLAFAFPGVATFFGWRSLFAEKLFAVWIPDFIVAFLLGIIFQYYTIKPMRGLSIGGGIVAAVKADTASISSWQIGMYGVMALIQFGWFRSAFGMLAPVDSPEFWFAMQLAMFGGFFTSFPVNWWLIHVGLKEKM